MSEQPGAASRPTSLPPEGIAALVPTDADVLLPTLAQAVLAVPGVVRLEPTLSTSGTALLVRHSATDGLRFLIRAGATEVDANIATDATCQARSVTHQVRATIGQTLTAHGYHTGTVTVSVLAVEAGQPALRR